MHITTINLLISTRTSNFRLPGTFVPINSVLLSHSHVCTLTSLSAQELEEHLSIDIFSEMKYASGGADRAGHHKAAKLLAKSDRLVQLRITERPPW
jgi:hypothetical protein